MTEHERDAAMDRRLRAHAGAWRAQLPTTGQPVLPPTGRRWLGPVLAAALAVTVIGGVALAVGGERDQDPARPTDPATSTSPTTPPSDVVPWRALPISQPQLPTTTTPPSPGPEQVASAPACRSAALRLGGPEMDASGGTDYWHTEVRTLGAPCRVQGYPTVQPLTGGRATPIAVSQGGRLDRPAGPVLVTRDNPAVLTVQVSNHQCPTVRIDQFRISLPGSDRAITLDGRIDTYCSPGEGQRPVTIWPLASSHPPTTKVRSPFDQIRAAGSLDLVVAAGEPVRFVVTLTSPTDLPLVPCPDYSVLTAAGEQRWALNCAGVPFRDAQDRPYLPAGRAVRFAIEAPAGDTSTPKFLWTLRTPWHRVELHGTLTVDSAGG